MIPASLPDIESALRRLRKERVLRVQRMAYEFGRPRITGSLLLALGMRETWLRNILGGAIEVDGKWVPQPNPAEQDAGVFQISKKYHREALEEMPAVESGTFFPVIEGVSAYDPGMVPTFKAAIPYVLKEIAGSIDFARASGVPEKDAVRFAAAAHNAGRGGALNGYKRGDLDAFTAGHDYSQWVVDAMLKTTSWLNKNTSWRYTV